MEWEDISMEFISNNAIKAITPEGVKTIYRTMTDGMYRGNTSKKQPTKAWYFLMLLASNNGVISEDCVFKFFNNTKSLVIRQQKCSLSRSLKKIFNIFCDPIMFNQKVREYKCKMQIKSCEDFDIHNTLANAKKIFMEPQYVNNNN